MKQIISHILYFKKLVFRCYPKFYIFTSLSITQLESTEHCKRFMWTHRRPLGSWNGRVRLVGSQNLFSPGRMAKSTSTTLFDGDLILVWLDKAELLFYILILVFVHHQVTAQMTVCFPKRSGTRAAGHKARVLWHCFEASLAEFSFPGQKFSLHAQIVRQKDGLGNVW